MKLNGWQRLWILATAIWSALVATITSAAIYNGAMPLDFGTLFAALSTALIPSTIVLILGIGVAWVRRGFGHN